MAHQLKLNLKHRGTQFSWDPEKVLAEALAEKALFLDKYPEYRPFQREIDTLLEKAGSPENRMTVLAVLMESKLVELHSQLRSLNAILIDVAASEAQN